MRGGSGVFVGVFAIASRGLPGRILVADNNRRGNAALRRNPAPPDVSPWRPARRRGLPLRRLAGGGGAVVVADPPARPARRVRLALPRRVRVRRLAGAPRRARRRGERWRRRE